MLLQPGTQIHIRYDDRGVPLEFKLLICRYYDVVLLSLA